jgi:hypothetical protein
VNIWAKYAKAVAMKVLHWGNTVLSPILNVREKLRPGVWLRKLSGWF